MTWNKTCLVVLLLATAACTEVRYLREGGTEPASGRLERTVVYKVEGDFYRSPPRCTIVMPIQWPDADPRLVRQVEEALGRHLMTKVDRVIGPVARDRAARQRVYDLGDADQRRRLARALRCDTVVEGETRDAQTTFALVWAQTRFGLAVSLESAGDGRPLWRASHTAERSAGGLPLSLTDVPKGAYSAGRLMKDREVFPSMVDDVVRRVMASLPDTRSLR
jgi:hypothetical protein